MWDNQQFLFGSLHSLRWQRCDSASFATIIPHISNCRFLPNMMNLLWYCEFLDCHLPAIALSSQKSLGICAFKQCKTFEKARLRNCQATLLCGPTFCQVKSMKLILVYLQFYSYLWLQLHSQSEYCRDIFSPPTLEDLMQKVHHSSW